MCVFFLERLLKLFFVLPPPQLTLKGRRKNIIPKILLSNHHMSSVLKETTHDMNITDFSGQDTINAVGVGVKGPQEGALWRRANSSHVVITGDKAEQNPPHTHTRVQVKADKMRVRFGV